MLNMKNLPAYELVLSKKLNSLNSDGYVLKHIKTGAKICLISNDDDNKVFQIGFRTPPNEDTGVPHIVEHTVLCGSDKYPIKDPFVELVKGSLNTFLNAMTFPDKTIYPIASYNDKDFQNLMDVYLDAVFHPNIYRYEEIFMQEGWHYEMESEDAPLTINGVVYNEMKGAYSSPDEVIFSEIAKALYPDTCYGKDSGGNPDAIPTLTREGYLDFHRAYYHPCNSYIYLYGDMDMEEKLNYIDKEYLSTFEPREIDSTIPDQKPFEEVKVVEKTFSIASEESEENKTIFAYGNVTRTVLDKELYIAMNVVNYALLASPGAVLKQTLLDEGIGNDISGVWSTSLKQPYFAIEVKNTNPEEFDHFRQVLEGTLRKVVKEGLDKKVLEAAINTMEFRYREADFGPFPKGLMYAIQSMDSWLYDDNDPFMHVDALDTYQSLREKVKTNYFEELVETWLLNNKHGAYIILKPEKALAAKKDAVLAEALAKKKESLSQEAIKEIVASTKHLKEYQETKDTPEQLECLPMLRRNDIKQEPLEIKNEVYRTEQVTVLHHNMYTNGIHYARYMFNVKKLSNELLPCLGLLQAVWGLMDTKNYSFNDLSSEIDRTTGGITGAFGFYEKVKTPEQFDLKFIISANTFYNQMGKATELISEIIETTEFDNLKRLRELVSENRSRMQSEISAAGNRYGAMRAESYHSRMGYIKDMIMGIGFYEYLAKIDDNFEDEVEKLISNLKKLNDIIFRKENLIVSSTCEWEEFERFEGEVKELCHHLSHADFSYSPDEPVLEKKNEGLMDASSIQYVCQTGNFRDAGFDFNGSMYLLKLILSYDYLWNNIRVKGGAYGCGCQIQKNGSVVLSTYRDPNLKNSLEVFKEIPAYLESFDVSEREMTKYVIGAFGAIDTPMNPSAKGMRSAGLYLRGITMEELRKERLQAINATVEDIKALAAPMRAILEQENICVVGNEENIKNEKDTFMSIRNIK